MDWFVAERSALLEWLVIAMAVLLALLALRAVVAWYANMRREEVWRKALLRDCDASMAAACGVWACAPRKHLQFRRVDGRLVPVRSGRA